MAKKKIDSYIFNPGISLLDNSNPNAYTLIKTNTAFIQEEANAWIANKVIVDSATNLFPIAVELLENNLNYIKKETVAYITDQIVSATPGSIYENYSVDAGAWETDVENNIVAITKDLKYGGNERSRYVQSLYWNDDVSLIEGDRLVEFDVYTWLEDLITNYIFTNTPYVSLQVQAAQVTSAQAAESSAVSKTSNILTNLRSVIQDGLGQLPTLTYGATFAEYTYNAAKCKRDIKYVLDAYLKDIRYGGNYETWGIASKYWVDEIPQIDGSRLPEIETHEFIRFLINNYIVTNTAFTSLQNPVTELQQINEDLIFESAVIGTSYTPTNAVYTPTTGQLVLTIGAHDFEVGNKIDIKENSLVFTCTLDNNATEHPYPRAENSNAPGGSDYAYAYPVVITSTTNNSITVNVGISSNTSDHTFLRAEANAISSANDGRTNELYALLADIILNGLSVRPQRTSGLGYIRVQGRVREEDLLIITNVSVGEIIYTFNDPGKLALCEFLKDYEGADSDFPSFDQTTDTITNIHLYADTSAHSIDDRLQIFVEDKEIRTRPFDFGTDAIERNRVANAQSMLDADFEYGLQPTKWQAIGMLRGYPSIYEIPGTEVPVNSVTTDASTTTEGIGQSIITVECAAPHDLQAGDPFTVKGLGGTALGIGRAEGSFVVYTVESASTFTYFAKSKVGLITGEVLSTTYTQLRKAGFYTGSPIGNPNFTVESNGSEGTLTVALNVLSDSDTIPFTGDAPEIGAPLVDATGAIISGAQVSAVNGDGGVAASTNLTVDAEIGDQTIEIDNTADVTVGLAIDSGDGSATFVTQVVGNTVTLTDPLTAQRVGSNVTYTSIPGTLISTSNGTGATFNVVRNAGNYDNVTISNGGTDYLVNDALIIAGSSVGGTNQLNNIFIRVTSVNSGVIDGISFEGIAAPADGTFFDIEGELQAGQGVGAVFDVSSLNNVYTVNLSSLSFNNIVAPEGVFNGNSATFDISYLDNSYSSVINNPGIDYQIGDRLIIIGDSFPNGVSPDNDILIEVLSVGSSGEILNTSISGTAPNAQNSYTPPVTYNGIGGDAAEFQIGTNGDVYNIISINNNGFGYNVGDTFDIEGIELGGTTPDNDAVITVDTTDAGGGITSASISGIALNFGEQLNNPADPFFGTGAEFNVQKNGSTWSASIANAGENYQIGDSLVIDLTVYNIESPTYDITIEVTATDLNGGLTAINVTGTSPDPGGSNYFVNDRIVIRGDSFQSGVSPDNDITIDVQSVGSGGELSTFTISGTAPDAQNLFSNVAYSTAGNGINAQIQVNTNGTNYDAVIEQSGENFAIGDQLIVAGNLLGGATPGNDLIITVSDVDGFGAILDIGVSGTARNSFTVLNVTGTIEVGTDATFEIENAATVYTVFITTPGQGYIAGQTIVVPGNTIGGITPTNNLTITIDTVSVEGAIESISIAGTGGNGSGTYTAVSSEYAPLSGQLASFDVQRTTDYAVTVASGGEGSGYYVGNQVLILGSQLGGASPANDILAIVTAVDDPYTGGITAVSATGSPTTSGQIDFISTVTFTEFTTKLLPSGTTVDFRALATIGIEFESNHGLVPGDTFIVTIGSDDGITDGTGNNHKLAAGAYIATSVPTLNSLTYQARAAGTIDTAINEVEGIIYARPDSFFIHRPYDGGVQLGTGGPQHGAQAIRQSKNYIRYQSGKGIMYTTGALFAPSYDLLSASATGTAVGSIIEFETDDSDHGLQVGGKIEILGVLTPGYNGIYIISDIISERKFRVLATTTLGSTVPSLGSTSQVSTKEWHGAIVRAGAFDEQNGIFWQYDGKNLAVTQRSSTFQLAGLGSIDAEDNTITGINCRFLDQCSAGDRIVIRGMTHVVSQVIDNNTMTITPDYRGVRKAVNAKLCLVVDKTVKQNDFNLDPVNGIGKSGYDVDISKMQMIGIQYSWYGAGFIDFMLRGADGNFIFTHRMRNSNVNTEAFMRSGNLPVRYEVTNEGPNGKLAEDIDDTQTTIPLIDASFFPDTGATIYIDNEIIVYTAIEGNNLINCQRGATLVNYQAGAQRQYSAGPAEFHVNRTGVIIISSTTTPIISHWGSAFITDGGFDEDRGYIFSYASAGIDISTTRATAFLLRLAPSVSNAITGDLGDRELLNRAQLLLNGVEVTSDQLGATDTGGIIVEGILNPSNYPEAVSDVSWGSLSGLAEGGQPSFAQIAPGAGINWDVGTAVTADVLTLGAADTLSNIDIVRGDRNRSYFYVPSSEEYDIGVGSTVTGTNGRGQNIFQGNTTVTSVQRNNTTTYDGSGNITVDRINISRSLSQTQGWWMGFGTGTATLQPVNAGGNITIPFVAAYISSGVTQGTKVDLSETAFPSGTSVTNVSNTVHNGSTYYFVTFNQPTTSDFTAGEVITFDLSGAAYAQPGETIFKFIAVPGERSELDLSPIKELTNTSLGGRGTFPNGPDVLAINVYKTSGDPIEGNVILKWGEAQA